MAAAPDVGVEMAPGAVQPPLPYPGQERRWRVSEAAAVAEAAAVVEVTRPRSPSDLPPDVIAAQAAIRGLQQMPEVLTVKATADSIAFLDPRGEWTFAITNKAAKLEINGANVEVKTRWDKLVVRQEFATAQTRLVRTWELDDQDHLVLKARVESMTISSKEVKAVYDRQ